MKSRLAIKRGNPEFNDIVVLLLLLTLLQILFAMNATIKATWPEFAQPFGHIGYDVFFAALSLLFLYVPVRVSKTTVLSSGISAGILILVVSQKFHLKVSNIFGFPTMKSASADWESIYNYAHCPGNSMTNACDTYGRAWYYGNIWKAFAVIPNSHLFLYLGYFAFVFGITALVWSIWSIFPSAMLIILSSPAIFMLAERINSDILLLGLVIVICANVGHLPKRFSSAVTIILSCALAAAKPFFGIIFLRRSLGIKNLMIGTICVTASIYISFGGLSNISAARKATLYSLSTQFGADMIGALIVPHETFYVRLLWGVIITGIIVLLFMRNKIVEIGHLALREKPNKFNLVLASALMFSLSYLSGSQVFYKTILGLPFAIWFFVSISSSEKRTERCYGLLVVLGSLGVGGTIIRVLATTSLAVASIEFVLKYFKSEITSKIHT
jgi:hypothetical protein